MSLLVLNRLLNIVAAVGAAAGGALAAGQVPAKWQWLAGGLAALGTAAAKYAKTPSQAMAAAAPAPKAVPPAPSAPPPEDPPPKLAA